MHDIASKLLILVDGSSYLYRAFYALPPLSNSRGEPTGAVYGVVNMLRKLLADYQPDYIAVVFDAKGKTFRDELFEQYKAQRPPMPDDLQFQLEPLYAIVRANGLPCLVVEGVEADDVIGTLARQAAAKMSVLISTSDKDMAQLVNERITLINTMTDAVLDRQGVIKKFGIAPEQMVDYLALVGDSSDNIPGVPNVGPKTAVKWLNAYGSLDNLIAHAQEITGKVGENLRAHLGQLALARRLATIDCGVDLAVSPENLHRQPLHVDTLSDLYRRLEFKNWLKQLTEQADREDPAPGAPNTPQHYETLLTEADLNKWLEPLRHAELFAFDTETTSLDYMRAEIVGVSFAVTPGQAAYIPLAHDYPGAPQQLSREAVLAKLQPLLEDPARPKLGHNLKYDMSVLANHGIRLEGIRHDTMLESYVLNSTASRHDMDTLSRKYLGHETTTFEDIAGKGVKQLTFNRIPIEQAAPYAAEDADVTLRLHHHFWPLLSKETSLASLYNEIEVPLVSVLSRMERNGVLVDTDLLRKQSKEFAEIIAARELHAYELAGEEFNLSSPKQIQEILYNKLGLPVSLKTPTGQPSTGEEALQELAEQHPLAALILDYRAMSKLKSTYTDRLPEQVDPQTGRIHTSYHQAVAATGRLSSSDPNLQNIPIRSQEGRRIRQAFIAPPGYKIVAADYSQIELRIMAHLSGDERLLHAFASGTDIHTATAAEIFGVAPEHVGAEQRRNAKAINFGLIYGMSAFGLARQLGIDRTAAQQYIDLYFSRYPGAKQFMDQTREQARKQGYVETLFGRRLYLPDIKARQQQRRLYAERSAINAPMQGTAADIIKLAMLRADEWLRHSGADARMIMQVHDELVFEVAEGAVETYSAEIERHMKEAATLSIPLVVDIGSGSNWDEAH
jgi:DNA polymerase-1